MTVPPVVARSSMLFGQCLRLIIHNGFEELFTFAEMCKPVFQFLAFLCNGLFECLCLFFPQFFSGLLCHLALDFAGMFYFCRDFSCIKAGDRHVEIIELCCERGFVFFLRKKDISPHHIWSAH